MKLFVKIRRTFPDPEKAMDDGLVAFGDEINSDLLLEAYSFGIFPWPHEGLPLLWFSPEERGVLDFKELHIPKSLKKFLKNAHYQITFNKAFHQVITECAKATRKNQLGTWITPYMEKAYLDFHQKGYAHSVECWEGGALVGGLYGVYVGGVFSGESMFYKKTNASKLCLLKLIEVLKKNGLSWMDIQMVTPLLERLGGKYIPRSRFMKRLEIAKLDCKPLELALN